MSRWIALAALVVMAAACGDSGGTGAASPSRGKTSPSPSPLVSAKAFTFTLSGIGTPASGTMTLTATADTMSLQVMIRGLQPNSSHISHIHNGTCAQKGGIAFALNQVVADGQGESTTRTTLKAVYPPKTGRWYVVVHAGPDMNGANSSYLLCGNLSS